MARIGQEIVYRIAKTPKGVKVIEYDGTGLADGIMTKRRRRYFYGDGAEADATEYAERLADGDEDRRVVNLGERV